MGLSDRTREAVMEKARSREGKRSDIQREVLLRSVISWVWMIGYMVIFFGLLSSLFGYSQSKKGDQALLLVS